MDKQALLAWIQALPDDIEALPFDLAEIQERREDWNRQPELAGITFNAVYEQKVHTEMTLRLRFSGTVRGEFQRDQFGHPQWANVRLVRRAF